MLGLLNFRKQRAMHADDRASIEEVRYVVIDLELTGLDERRDSIVSLAGIKMFGGRIDFETVFYRLVKPRTELTSESIIIHEITPSEVREKPDIEKVLSDFMEFCGSDVVVGHCVSIDLSFINRELKSLTGSTMNNPVLDTSAVYAWIQKKFYQQSFPSSFKDSGLFDIAKHFGVPVTGAHNALMDAFITAQVLQRFIPMLREGGIKSIGDLLILGNPSKGGDNVRLTQGMYSF
jgi:DNA polymerase-3 subunit epsilon